MVIIGAGGFGREVHDVVEAMDAAGSADSTHELLGYLADGHADEELIAARGSRLLGATSLLETLPADVRYVIAIGSGAARRRIDAWATGLGRHPVTLVHPTATLGRHQVELGPGTIVCAGACVTTNVRTGRHVHLNLGVTVGHDTVLGDYVTASPNASISGNVVLDDEVNLGTGCSIIERRRVGARTVVGAGAAVVRDLPADVTAVGVPAVPRAAGRGG